MWVRASATSFIGLCSPDATLSFSKLGGLRLHQPRWGPDAATVVQVLKRRVCLVLGEHRQICLTEGLDGAPLKISFAARQTIFTARGHTSLAWNKSLNRVCF
jgi:hypothetical protein